MSTGNKYLTLTDNAVLRRLEKRYLYDVSNDELFEINRRAYNFILKLDGQTTEENLYPDQDFLKYCVSNKLIERHSKPVDKPVIERIGPTPSLRYLELLITRRCTRECVHCYLGKPKPADMPMDRLINTLTQFEELGGLRVLISGGEPLAHPKFDAINEALPKFGLRKVLLTNGDLLTKSLAKELNFHEVQVSLDGLEKGHDYIRGKGSYKKAMAAIDNARDAGLDVSVATMIHRKNLGELSKLKAMIAKMDLREWNLDAPVTRGMPAKVLEDFATPEECAEFMKLGFGGSYHGGDDGFVCGRHLAAVAENGDVLKCGFFTKKPLGSIEGEGLRAAWLKKPHDKLVRTACKKCPAQPECGGGCRYRAENERDRDLYMCAVYGIKRGAEYSEEELAKIEKE